MKIVNSSYNVLVAAIFNVLLEDSKCKAVVKLKTIAEPESD